MLNRYLVEMIGANGNTLHVGFVDAHNVDDAKDRLFMRRKGIEMTGPKVKETRVSSIKKTFVFEHVGGGER